MTRRMSEWRMSESCATFNVKKKEMKSCFFFKIKNWDKLEALNNVLTRIMKETSVYSRLLNGDKISTLVLKIIISLKIWNLPNRSSHRRCEISKITLLQNTSGWLLLTEVVSLNHSDLTHTFYVYKKRQNDLSVWARMLFHFGFLWYPSFVINLPSFFPRTIIKCDYINQV